MTEFAVGDKCVDLINYFYFFCDIHLVQNPLGMAVVAFPCGSMQLRIRCMAGTVIASLYLREIRKSRYLAAREVGAVTEGTPLRIRQRSGLLHDQIAMTRLVPTGILVGGERGVALCTRNAGLSAGSIVLMTSSATAQSKGTRGLSMERHPSLCGMRPDLVTPVLAADARESAI